MRKVNKAQKKAGYDCESHPAKSGLNMNTIW